VGQKKKKKKPICNLVNQNIQGGGAKLQRSLEQRGGVVGQKKVSWVHEKGELSGMYIRTGEGKGRTENGRLNN